MNMKLDRKGITRIVFVFGTFVIKIPNFFYQHDHFLSGCKNNWWERKCWKQWKGNKEVRSKLCPTLFCSWFGLIQIQSRAAILHNDAFLNDNELKEFHDITTDIKSSNFGYYKNRIVCVDYA